MTASLRLVWPQYQGGEPAAVESLTGLDPAGSRVAYGVGGQLTAALAPPTAGPVEHIDVAAYDPDPHEIDGIIDKAEVLRQNAQALERMRTHDAERVVTLGGCCSVSAAPFSYLADRYDDLAVVWLDSHPDTNLPGGLNHGFNTMVVTHLIGRGDGEMLAQLPGRVAPERVLLAGTHAWDDQDPDNIRAWGLSLQEPAATDDFVSAVLAWIAGTGCTRVALHFDLDVIDSDEVAFGMAWEPGGISRATAEATVAAVATRYDLVGLTVAEFVPRAAVTLQRILGSLPLLSNPS